MSVEERVIKLEWFAAGVRKYVEILTEIIRRHDKRLDEHVKAFAEANRSMAALADVQIRTEEKLNRLADAQAQTEIGLN